MIDLVRQQGANDLNRLVQAVVRMLSPRAIYLFGARARARGAPGPDSDFDLLVVVPDETPDEEISPQRTYDIARAVGLPADIVACRASAFDRWRDSVGTLTYEAARNGTLVYGA
jgi:predicted nucleotidyltransferase